MQMTMGMANTIDSLYLITLHIFPFYILCCMFIETRYYYLLMKRE